MEGKSEREERIAKIKKRHSEVSWTCVFLSNNNSLKQRLMASASASMSENRMSDSGDTSESRKELILAASGSTSFTHFIDDFRKAQIDWAVERDWMKNRIFKLEEQLNFQAESIQENSSMVATSLDAFEKWTSLGLEQRIGVLEQKFELERDILDSKIDQGISTRMEGMDDTALMVTEEATEAIERWGLIQCC